MIIITSPKSKEEFRKYYDLRFRVLRAPLGQPKGTEKDDYEPISYHFMAIDDSTGEIVGCVKFYEKETGIGQFSYMAVADKYQRKGIGRMLMDAVETKARAIGCKKLGTMTRVTATRFYEKFGYHITGVTHDLFGITQLSWMEKDL